MHIRVNVKRLPIKHKQSKEYFSPPVKAKREYKFAIRDGNNSKDYRGHRPHTDTDRCLRVEIGIDVVRQWCRKAGTRREDRGSEAGWTRVVGERRQGDAGRGGGGRVGYIGPDEMRRVCKVARNVMDDAAEVADVKD